MTDTRERNVLIVVTGHTELGNTGEYTGFHYEELSTPYYALKDAGYNIELASPKGGAVMHDPSSLPDEESQRAESVKRFLDDDEALRAIQNTIEVSTINPDAFDGVYLPGGHGTMWDFPDCAALQDLIAKYDREDKVIAAVCHGPAAFVNVQLQDGSYFVDGRTLNSFTDSEERDAEKDDVVPFLLEETLRERGADFEKGANWEGFVVQDANLITGQNPHACAKLADKMVSALEERRKQRYAA
ncbi:MAG: type 1 glutamine amidotransferase domain-containing protein [Alphaproteobacteria bacterium]|nr:type 1 glutamine amidotransferase domain-containing protein [Alphaproteobacteria bacterium]